MCNKEKQVRFIRNNNQEGSKKFSPFEYYTVEESLRYIDCSIDKLYRLIRSGRVPVKKNDKNTSRFIFCIKGVDLLNLCRNSDGELVYCKETTGTSEQDIERFVLKHKSELLPIFRKKTVLFHHQYDDATELMKTRLYYYFRDNTVDFKPEPEEKKASEQVTITVHPQPITQEQQEPKPVKKVIPHISERGRKIMELAEFLGDNGISIPASKKEKEVVIFKITELMRKTARSLEFINSLDFDDEN